MEDLQSAGMGKLEGDDFHNISPQACVVTRAHGTVTARCKLLRDNFSNVVDGTCPHVAMIRNTIARTTDSGRDVIIIGNRNHPEILALVDAARRGRCFAIGPGESVDSLPKNLNGPLIISQSTIDVATFRDAAEKISKIYAGVEIVDTICSSSRMRQHGVTNLEKLGAQAIVVIGGKHSNNTVVLVEAAKNTGLPVFPVETAGDLPVEELKKFSPIGIATGASTGENSLSDIVHYLDRL
jgi:4-hydroxy-3-methylbut-2-enyl diphosphate reductase